MYRWVIAATLLEAGYSADKAKQVAFGDNDTTAFFNAFTNLADILMEDTLADAIAELYQKHYDTMVSIIPEDEVEDFQDIYGE